MNFVTNAKDIWMETYVEGKTNGAPPKFNFVKGATLSMTIGDFILYMIGKGGEGEVGVVVWSARQAAGKPFKQLKAPVTLTLGAPYRANKEDNSFFYSEFETEHKNLSVRFVKDCSLYKTMEDYKKNVSFDEVTEPNIEVDPTTTTVPKRVTDMGTGAIRQMDYTSLKTDTSQIYTNKLKQRKTFFEEYALPLLVAVGGVLGYGVYRHYSEKEEPEIVEYIKRQKQIREAKERKKVAETNKGTSLSVSEKAKQVSEKAENESKVYDKYATNEDVIIDALARRNGEILKGKKADDLNSIQKRMILDNLGQSIPVSGTSTELNNLANAGRAVPNQSNAINLGSVSIGSRIPDVAKQVVTSTGDVLKQGIVTTGDVTKSGIGLIGEGVNQVGQIASTGIKGASENVGEVLNNSGRIVSDTIKDVGMDIRNGADNSRAKTISKLQHPGPKVEKGPNVIDKLVTASDTVAKAIGNGDDEPKPPKNPAPPKPPGSTGGDDNQDLGYHTSKRGIKKSPVVENDSMPISEKSSLLANEPVGQKKTLNNQPNTQELAELDRDNTNEDARRTVENTLNDVIGGKTIPQDMIPTIEQQYKGNPDIENIIDNYKQHNSIVNRGKVSNTMLLQPNDEYNIGDPRPNKVELEIDEPPKITKVEKTTSGYKKLPDEPMDIELLDQTTKRPVKKDKTTSGYKKIPDEPVEIELIDQPTKIPVEKNKDRFVEALEDLKSGLTSKSISMEDMEKHFGNDPNAQSIIAEYRRNYLQEPPKEETMVSEPIVGQSGSINSSEKSFKATPGTSNIVGMKDLDKTTTPKVIRTAQANEVLPKDTDLKIQQLQDDNIRLKNQRDEERKFKMDELRKLGEDQIDNAEIRLGYMPKAFRLPPPPHGGYKMNKVQALPDQQYLYDFGEPTGKKDVPDTIMRYIEHVMNSVDKSYDKRSKEEKENAIKGLRDKLYNAFDTNVSNKYPMLIHVTNVMRSGDPGKRVNPPVGVSDRKKLTKAIIDFVKKDNGMDAKGLYKVIFEPTNPDKKRK